MESIQLGQSCSVGVGSLVCAVVTTVVWSPARIRPCTERWLRTELAILLTCCVFAVGCGKSTGRLAVNGEITVDGVAVDSGAIIFQPQSAGPKVGTKIIDGKYRFDRNNGPLPGEYRIEIYADSLRSFPMDDPQAFAEQMETDPDVVLAPNAIPEEFNKRSTLTAKPNKDNLKINFILKTKDE